LTHSKYGQQADVYSFGVVLVELFTGIPPYSDIVNLHPAQVLVWQWQWQWHGATLLTRACRLQQLVLRITTQGLRPNLGELPNILRQLVTECIDDNVAHRPSFSEIAARLDRMKDAGNSYVPPPPAPRQSVIAQQSSSSSGHLVVDGIDQSNNEIRIVVQGIDEQSINQ
jgi:serine/threonine protein kinase